MRQTHPEWENARQWYNPRLWQPTARKDHDIAALLFFHNNKLILIKSPEAHGVNVADLMEKNGSPLTWDHYEEHKPEENITQLVSLAGYPLEKEDDPYKYAHPI